MYYTWGKPLWEISGTNGENTNITDRTTVPVES